jgi:hypothetical protein
MAGYIGPQPVPQATQHRQSFVATANQTSFATAGYTPQFLDLYLNGVKLAGEDYTATNGSDVVLATGAATGDILEYVAYTPFEVANQTFTGTTSVDVLSVTGAAYIDEATAASADVAGSGQFWVKDDAPNIAMFTDDAGTDFLLNADRTVVIGPGNGNDFKSGGSFVSFVSFPTDVLITTIDYQYIQTGQDNVLENFSYKVGAGGAVPLDTYTGTAAGTRSATKAVSIGVSAGTRFFVGPNTSSNGNQININVSIHYRPIL